MAIVLYSSLAGTVEFMDAHNNRGTYTSGCDVPVEEVGSVRMKVEHSDFNGATTHKAGG